METVLSLALISGLIAAALYLLVETQLTPRSSHRDRMITAILVGGLSGLMVILWAAPWSVILS